MQNVVWWICAAALLCAPAGVPAQTVHNQADAAGRITYADRPDTSPSPLPGTAAGPASHVAIVPASNSAVTSQRAAIIEANEAARSPGQAEQVRRQGAVRLPVEQARGTGAGEANPRHARRQEKLRRMHEQAQRGASEVDGLLRARR